MAGCCCVVWPTRYLISVLRSTENGSLRMALWDESSRDWRLISGAWPRVVSYDSSCRRQSWFSNLTACWDRLESFKNIDAWVITPQDSDLIGTECGLDLGASKSSPGDCNVQKA